MALKYTYEDFKKAAEERGLLNSFSEYDLRLAQSDPSAGMSLIRYKEDYRNATTDEARTLANQGADSIRRTYGGYTGGDDGSGYYLETPSSFRYDKKAPVYENRYGKEADNARERLKNFESFSYDYSNDPVYGAYKKEYVREGKRATEDVLGSLAAASGGIPSSYAATAASQASDYYSSKLSDKIPELYDAAYNRYITDYNREKQNYEMLRDAENNEYLRYIDELNRYNTEKQDAYNQYLQILNYYDKNQEEIKADEQQAFENELALRKEDRSDRELELAEGTDAWKKQTALEQLELEKNTDEWKKQVALGELGGNQESLAWNKSYGMQNLNPSTPKGYYVETYDYNKEENPVLFTGNDLSSGKVTRPIRFADSVIPKTNVKNESILQNKEDTGNTTKNADKYSSLLRRISNQKTEYDMLKYIWSMYKAGTITEQEAEQLLKDSGIDTTKYYS